MTSYNKKKWRRYKLLKKVSSLQTHLPDTKIFSENAFWELLDKYGEIIIKPNDSRKGAMIIKETTKETYEILLENQTLFMNQDNIYNYVALNIRDRPYLIQQRIPLAQINERIFDFRVIVQRKRLEYPWEVTAMIVKVAKEGYAITTEAIRQKDLMYVEDAINQSTLQSFSPKEIMASIEDITLQFAQKLAKIYPKQRIFGFDMGVDHKGHVWFIEADLYPKLSYFRKLRDKTFYHRIKEYKNKFF